MGLLVASLLWKLSWYLWYHERGLLMSHIGVLVRWCLTLGGNTVNTDEKSLLKISCVCVCIQYYMYYSF